MKLLIFENKTSASKYIANKIKTLIQKNPNVILGLASGKTFIQIYEYLSETSKVENINWEKVKTFNLDEFYNCNGQELYSCKKYMHDRLFNNVNISENHVFFPPTINPSKDDYEKYDEILKKTNISYQLIGVGRNGHIGFNEPGSKISETTRKVNLAKTTIEDKANMFFNGDQSKIPTRAVTVGVKTILSGKNIVVCAFGNSKTTAIEKLIKDDEITSDYPLTFLKNAQNLTVIIDKDCFQNIQKISKNIEIINITL